MLLPFKNKIIFFRQLIKYGDITFKFVGRYFYCVVTIFQKIGLSKSKNLGKKKNCKICFLVFNDKKKSYCH